MKKKVDNTKTKNKKQISSKAKLIIIVITIITIVAIFVIRDFTTISKSEYEKIHSGMSYDEVVKIIGCEGKRGEGEDGFAVYSWKGNSKDIGLVRIMFYNGTVWFKQSYKVENGFINSK